MNAGLIGDKIMKLKMFTSILLELSLSSGERTGTGFCIGAGIARPREIAPGWKSEAIRFIIGGCGPESRAPENRHEDTARRYLILAIINSG
ncbi:MAG: hypothetical protein [Olavius algarvensis Gamma 3 endosymbiont]|nr:MAG: hypothetical protein [Olavius algarvensis Gamma 3 endosymbiont]